MNKYKKWFVLLGIFTFSLILFSQFSLAKPSISGTIKDSQTKEALPGAIVMLYASQKCPPEGTVKYGSYSTADGRFDIEVEGGTYALAVHLIGYKPFCQLIPIEGETTIDIELEQEPITLEPVVVLPAAYFTVTPSAVKVGEEVTASAKFNYDFDHARIFIDGMKEIYGGPCEISRDNIRKNEQLSVTCKATEAGEYKAILVIQRGGEEKREEEFITVGEKEAKAVIHAKVLGVNKNTASYIYYFPLQYYDWDKDCYKAYFEGGEEIEIYSGAYIQFYPDGSTIEKFGEISPVASDDIEWYFWVSEDDYSYEEKRLEWPEKYTPIKDFRPFKRFFYDASKDIAGYNEFYVVLKVGEWPNEDYNAIKIRVYPRFKQEKAKPVEKPEEKEGLGEEGEECSDEKPCASGLTCYFGRCMPEKIEEWQCIESDGMPKIFDQGKYIENPLYNNPNVPAVCIDFERHADECVSNSEVKEYGCKDGTCQPVIKKCPEGKICRDGRCVSRGEAVAVVKEGGIVKVNGCKILELKYTQVDSETFDANFEITKQKRKVLPKDAKVNGKEKMEMFLKEVSPLLIEEYKKYILDKERDARLYPGGCIAISNLVVKLMQDYGIDAYVADGEFFKPGEGWLTHNFVVLNIDGMEYIVDYTANQFTLPIEYEEIDSETVMKIKEGTDESKYDIIPVIIPIDKGENCNKEYTYKITTIIHKKPTEQDLEEHNVAELYRRIKDMLATKRMEKYSNDMVFLVSDEDWRRVLKLIPLVIWQKNKEECNTLVFSDPEIYESIIEKCAYPLLIYHKEGENFDIESINHFIEQYKGKKIVIADNINTLPANLLSELTISGASKIESMDNYMSYWKNPRKIVYVEDNYKLALIASVYASLINAPLIIAGERIDLNNKYVICVGDVSTRCNERYSLEELQKKYIELTKTSRLILVNPNDIDDRYCVNERLGNVNRLYCHDSLAAPLLAAAKNELIIFTDNSDADSIREDVHNKIADLFGSYTNIKYFTTIASPPAIRLSKYVLERVIGISLFKQYNSLERIVLNFDDDITEEIPFGRIFGITISDTSSYIMRSVFYKKLYEDIYSYRKPSILSIAHSFDPPQFFQPLLAHEIEKLGQYEFTCYVGKKEFSRGVCKVSTSPRLSEYKMKNIILFSNHGNTNLWGSTLSSKEMPWFDLSLGIADACLTISYPRAKEKKSLFGANFIRKGGIGYYGTLTESLATTLNIVEVNEVTSYNFLHSLLESGSSLGVILKREVERNPQEINKMTTILLGDPTLKLDLPVIDLFYYPDLTN
ncbi:MAG TPA: carboxypeptidase-like regulatory domain-containing protein, partial [Candidatus Aenigmarchaeota archaeon]|nr:carboxypeptidase-like regulatory domain-containing protein [Candidatus Aenigmarchaeota archaeon]